MSTILEILNKTKDFFEKKGIEKPRLNAEWIIAKGLGCSRLDLFLRFEEKVPEAQLAVLRELVRRRGSREPLQYVLGEMPFLDLNLKIDKRALIPRPETEDFVDRLVKYWGKLGIRPKKVLDLGTGSGAIALGLAYYCKDMEVVGVDKSEGALSLAKENAGYCGLADRVSFLESDWFSNVDGTFDWIVANPPYLTESEWRLAQPEVKDFEARSALVAENEGIADLEKILVEGMGYLNQNGGIALETGIAHHSALEEIAKRVGYGKWESWDDLLGRNRYFLVYK